MTKHKGGLYILDALVKQLTFCWTQCHLSAVSSICMSPICSVTHLQLIAVPSLPLFTPLYPSSPFFNLLYPSLTLFTPLRHHDRS